MSNVFINWQPNNLATPLTEEQWRTLPRETPLFVVTHNGAHEHYDLDGWFFTTSVQLADHFNEARAYWDAWELWWYDFGDDQTVYYDSVENYLAQFTVYATSPFFMDALMRIYHSASFEYTLLLDFTEAKQLVNGE